MAEAPAFLCTLREYEYMRLFREMADGKLTDRSRQLLEAWRDGYNIGAFALRQTAEMLGFDKQEFMSLYREDAEARVLKAVLKKCGCET